MMSKWRNHVENEKGQQCLKIFHREMRLECINLGLAHTYSVLIEINFIEQKSTHLECYECNLYFWRAIFVLTETELL